MKIKWVAPTCAFTTNSIPPAEGAVVRIVGDGDYTVAKVAHVVTLHPTKRYMGSHEVVVTLAKVT